MMLGDFYAAGHEDIKTCPKLLAAFNGIMGSDESVMLKAIFGTNDDANDTLYWLRVAAVVITGIEFYVMLQPTLNIFTWTPIIFHYSLSE